MSKRRRTETGFSPHLGVNKRSKRTYRASPRTPYRKPTRRGGFTDGEVKYRDRFWAQNWDSTAKWKHLAVGTATGSQEPLNGLLQDDSPTGRDGRKALMKSLHIKMSFELDQEDEYDNPADEDNQILRYDDQYWRFCIVMDKQANKSKFSWNEVFKDNGDARWGPLEFRNLEWSGRFKVLYDKTFRLTRNGNFGFGIDAEGVNTTYYTAPHAKKLIKINIPLNDVVMFDGPNDTVGTITKNAIYAGGCRLLNHSSQTQPGDMDVFANCRIRFVG